MILNNQNWRKNIEVGSERLRYSLDLIDIMKTLWVSSYKFFSLLDLTKAFDIVLLNWNFYLLSQGSCLSPLSSSYSRPLSISTVLLIIKTLVYLFCPTLNQDLCPSLPPPHILNPCLSTLSASSSNSRHLSIANLLLLIKTLFYRYCPSPPPTQNPCLSPLFSSSHSRPLSISTVCLLLLLKALV